jgi:hypothetical protein
MKMTVKISPPNSLILIAGEVGVEIPASMRGLAISATKSCIAVGCRAEPDGETELQLGSFAEFSGVGNPSFRGSLETPNGVVIVSTIHGDDVLRAPTAQQITKLAIWLNDPIEPYVIVIGVVD